MSKAGLLSVINSLAKLALDEAAAGFRSLEPARSSTPEEARQWLGKLFWVPLC
jgi:hypothetical protein